MFVRQPQFRNASADVQVFIAHGARSPAADRTASERAWNKPPGVSHVYMMLIGSGGRTSSLSDCSGCGAVTVWYGAAQNVPDFLIVRPGNVNYTNTEVQYRNTSGTAITLLTAESASFANAGNGAGGGATAAGAFANSGFYQSIAGVTGNSTQSSAAATTFLSPGSSSSNVSNYGYSIPGTDPTFGGYFQLSPIPVGIGGKQSIVTAVGCGVHATATGAEGGPGMVLIASW